MGERPPLVIEAARLILFVVIRRVVSCVEDHRKWYPFFIEQRLHAARDKGSDEDLIGARLQCGVEFGHALVQPRRQPHVAVPHHQMDILMDDHGKGACAARSHYDVVTVRCGVVVCRREFIQAIRFVLLCRAEGDDPHGDGVGRSMTEHLKEEGAHLFHVAQRVACRAGAAAAVYLEVSGIQPYPSRLGRTGICHA